MHKLIKTPVALSSAILLVVIGPSPYANSQVSGKIAAVRASISSRMAGIRNHFNPRPLTFNTSSTSLLTRMEMARASFSAGINRSQGHFLPPSHSVKPRVITLIEGTGSSISSQMAEARNAFNLSPNRFIPSIQTHIDMINSSISRRMRNIRSQFEQR